MGDMLSVLQYELEDESNQYDASQPLIALQLLYHAACVQRGEPTPWATYVRALPKELNTPVLWPRSLCKDFLAGTTLLEDARQLRLATLVEFRRLRHILRTSGFAEWMGRLGLEASSPCPLTGHDTSAAQRWLFAQSLVRSRAYVVIDGEGDGHDGEHAGVDGPEGESAGEGKVEGGDEDEGGRRGQHGALLEFEGAEMVLSPLIDLSNHDDALTLGVSWGDGRGAVSRQSLALRTERRVAAGEAVCSTYGRHSRCGSLLAFGFCTAAQRATFSYRLRPHASSDRHAATKSAVLSAAGIETPLGGGARGAMFDLPSDPAEVSGELLQTLRLLALPPLEATRLLDGARPLPDDECTGFGEPPLMSAAGIDVWASLEAAVPLSIERAAYAMLLRDCRVLMRALREGQETAVAAIGRRGVATQGGAGEGEVAPAVLVEAARAARDTELEAVRRLQAVAIEEARRLPRSSSPDVGLQSS